MHVSRIMKKIALIIIVSLTFSSCSLDDSGNSVGDFFFQYIPIEDVVMPVEFEFGQTYVIEYTYFRPSSCHFFNDLFYDIDLNVRTIAVINTVQVDNGQCLDLQDELVTRTFNFLVQNTGTYQFRFWQGEDSNGEDVYLEIEVPVIE